MYGIKTLQEIVIFENSFILKSNKTQLLDDINDKMIDYLQQLNEEGMVIYSYRRKNSIVAIFRYILDSKNRIEIQSLVIMDDYKILLRSIINRVIQDFENIDSNKVISKCYASNTESIRLHKKLCFIIENSTEEFIYFSHDKNTFLNLLKRYAYLLK